MSDFIRIRTPAELLEAIRKKPMRFFILLNYGAWSVKRIRYKFHRRTFSIHHEIDGTRQELTAGQLMSARHGNIGPAMRAGAFYAEVA
jgi:hypothetical protein